MVSTYIEKISSNKCGITIDCDDDMIRVSYHHPFTGTINNINFLNEENSFEKIRCVVCDKFDNEIRFMNQRKVSQKFITSMEELKTEMLRIIDSHQDELEIAILHMS
jgi:hypothetical protein